MNEYTTQTCSKCGAEFPLTEEYFHRDAKTKAGFRRSCKKCVSEQRKQYRENNKDKISEANARYYAGNKEYIKARVRDYSAAHKEDISVRRKEYYRANRDKIIAYQREYYVCNKEKIAARGKAYYKANYEHLEQKKREYAARNAEALKDYKRGHYLKHKERYLESNRLNREKNRARNNEWMRVYVLRRRALKKSLPDTLTNAQWKLALGYFNDCCAGCGRPVGLWHTLAADHWVPLSSPECPGTVATNIIPLCHGRDGCNNSKHNKPPEQWLRERFSPKKAKRILKRIEEYFSWVRRQS